MEEQRRQWNQHDQTQVNNGKPHRQPKPRQYAVSFDFLVGHVFCQPRIDTDKTLIL
jgi:hypothetical protein